MNILSAEQFLKEAGVHPVIDVRSPAEFEAGHIPGAINIPLFTNAERAEIGTLYKQQGRKTAIKRGLELVGPKLAGFITQAEALTSAEKLLIHCWRGGMRSQSMAQLFEAYGFRCGVLQGGYKAYRNYQLSLLEKPWSFVVITGYTGIGKTEILRELRKLGEQTIDLEELANHHGSTFGGLVTGEQPSSEHFQNLLFEKLASLNHTQRIWLEDESYAIGKVHLPTQFYQIKQDSLHICIHLPLPLRIKRLARTYGAVEKSKVLAGIEVVKKKLRNHYQECLEAVTQGDAEKVVALLLTYYDRSYEVGLQKKPPEKMLKFQADTDSPPQTAKALVELVDGKPEMTKRYRRPGEARK